jgi:hypothetical protein
MDLATIHMRPEKDMASIISSTTTSEVKDIKVFNSFELFASKSSTGSRNFSQSSQSRSNFDSASSLRLLVSSISCPRTA